MSICVHTYCQGLALALATARCKLFRSLKWCGRRCLLKKPFNHLACRLHLPTFLRCVPYDESSECATARQHKVAGYRLERTLMGCADPPSKGVGAPHQCSWVSKKRSGWGEFVTYPSFWRKSRPSTWSSISIVPTAFLNQYDSSHIRVIIITTHAHRNGDVSIFFTHRKRKKPQELSIKCDGMNIESSQYRFWRLGGSKFEAISWGKYL